MTKSLQAAAVALAATLVSLSAPALAQDNAAPQRDNASQVVDELAACRGIADDGKRLACFDRTAAALVEARERKDVVIVDRAEMRKTRRSLFGFPLPKIKLFGGGDDDYGADEPEIKSITSKVTAVSDSGFSKWLITLEEGSRWQTTEVAKFSPPKPGREVTVERAAFGGYFIKYGSRMVRAQRVE